MLPIRETGGRADVGLVLTDGDPEEDLRRRFGDAVDVVKQGTLYGSVDQIVEKVGRYEAAGAQWLNIGVRAPFELEALERLCSRTYRNF